MGEWTPVIILAGIVWGLPAIGLVIEVYFAPIMEDR